MYINFIFIIFFFEQCLSQKALVLSSSIGFYNYRQAANAIQIYHDLKENGFRDQDILLFTGEISACCQKNPVFGSLSFYDGVYDNMFSNIEQDYYYPQMHAQQVSDVLSHRYPEYTLNKKRLSLSKKEPFFIYITGHGGDFYFKIREREAIIDEQFAHIFKSLDMKDLTESIVLFSDSCSAITPFQTIKINNFLGFASSSFDEKSQSHGHDSVLNSAKSDDFSFYFDEFLKHENEKKSQSFKDIEKYMDFDKLKVNSKMITNGIKKSELINKYVKRNKTGVYRKFKGKNKIV